MEKKEKINQYEEFFVCVEKIDVKFKILKDLQKELDDIFLNEDEKKNLKYIFNEYLNSNKKSKKRVGYEKLSGYLGDKTHLIKSFSTKAKNILPDLFEQDKEEPSFF